MSSSEVVESIEDKHRYLNEYAVLGAYHAELRMSRSWLPRYFRRFHLGLSVLKNLVAADATIMDVGGAEGLFIQALEDAGFMNVFGIDLFAPFRNQRMMRGDICALPIADNTLTAITCFDVLEHIPLDRQELAMKELMRVLKPSGIAFISVPNMAHLKSRLKFLIKGRPWRNKLDKHPGELTSHEREGLLQSAGFECIDKVGIHLTIASNPSSPSPFGQLLSRIMFSHQHLRICAGR